MGSCIASCIASSPSFAAANIVSSIELESYFNQVVKKKWSINGFSESYTLKYEKFHLNELDEKTLDRKEVILNEVIAGFVAKKLVEVFKADKSIEFSKFTMGQEMYLSAELSRSLAAWIINDQQKFADYTGTGLLHKSEPLEMKSLEAFGNAIRGVADKVLDPESSDLGVIRALQIRFARSIIGRLLTYDVKDHFMAIYQKMNMGLAQSNLASNKNRVSSLV